MTNLAKLISAAAGTAALALTAGYAAQTAHAGGSCCGTDTVLEKDTQTVQHEDDAQDLVATAKEAGQFDTLAKALQEAGLVETLQGDGPFTVFAPTDDAFDALPEGALDALMQDKDKLKDVLLYHVVQGKKVTADQVTEMDGEAVATAQGNELNISVADDGTVMLNDDATVTNTDVQASNGVIHVIDTVLMP